MLIGLVVIAVADTYLVNTCLFNMPLVEMFLGRNSLTGIPIAILFDVA